MNRIIAVSFCIFLFASLSSCIEEDLTDCPPGLRVVFSKDDGPVAQEDLYKATVFFFDENDIFIDSWEIENPVLDRVYTPEIKPDSGKYNMVVWFNLISPYSGPKFNETALRNFNKNAGTVSLHLPGMDREQPVPLPLLLYGALNNVNTMEVENPYTIPVRQNNNSINLTINGLPRTDDTYLFSITDNNGSYKFDNSFADCEPFSYKTTAHYPADSNVLEASLSVLKLSADRPIPLLTVLNRTTGVQVFPSGKWTENNLIQLILKANPANDFNKTHTYDIDITFDPEEPNAGISISINGWEIKSSDIDLIPD